jgi:hypothetical protein
MHLILSILIQISHLISQVCRDWQNHHGRFPEDICHKDEKIMPRSHGCALKFTSQCALNWFEANCVHTIHSLRNSDQGYSLHENISKLLASRTSELPEFTSHQWFLLAPLKYIIKKFEKTNSQSDFLVFNFHWPTSKFTGLGLRTSGFSWRLRIRISLLWRHMVWHAA